MNIISGVIPNDSENFETIEKYGVSYIFQDDRLIDWLTVGENIMLVVKKFYNEKLSEELCDKYLDLVGIKEYKNYPIEVKKMFNNMKIAKEDIYKLI